MAHGQELCEKNSTAGKIFCEKAAPQAKLIEENAPQTRIL